MPSKESTARKDIVYLTLELLSGDDPISGQIRHDGTTRVTPFSGWTGLIAGIQQLWQQAEVETGRQVPTLLARFAAGRGSGDA